MVKLVSGRCQFQLLVHVPVCQADRAVQVKESSCGFKMKSHVFLNFTAALRRCADLLTGLQVVDTAAEAEETD